MTMKKTIILMLACMCVFMNASAQRNSGRLSLGVGLLYENGMDVTLAYEHEMTGTTAMRGSFSPTAI